MTSSRSTASMRCEDLVDGEDRLLEQDGASQRLHAAAGALHAEHELPLEVVLGARRWRRPSMSASRSRSASRMTRIASSTASCARAEVDGREAGVGVQRRVRVHGVGEAALLAHLLEEVRAPGAAEDGVDDEDGVAVRVAALGPGPPRQTWYCSVSFCVKRARWRVSGTLRSARRTTAPGSGRKCFAASSHEVVVVHVAAGGDHDARVHVVGVVIGAHGVEVERRQRLASGR